MGQVLALLCFLLWVITGLAAGSTAMLLMLFLAFRYFEAPDMVPPVPTPATRISMLPSGVIEYFRTCRGFVIFWIGRVFKLLE